MKDFLQSERFKTILRGFGIAIAALLLFQAGIFVGYHKAEFSYRLGDNYSRTFGEPQNRMLSEKFTSAGGTIGKIIRLNLPEITVEDRDKIEKIIVTDNDTAIRRFREELGTSDLKVNDNVIAIGTPDSSGKILARLIRLIPFSSTTTPSK